MLVNISLGSDLKKEIYKDFLAKKIISNVN